MIWYTVTKIPFWNFNYKKNQVVQAPLPIYHWEEDVPHKVALINRAFRRDKWLHPSANVWTQQRPMRHNAYVGRLCVVSAARRSGDGEKGCPNLENILHMADLEYCKTADSKENWCENTGVTWIVSIRRFKSRCQSLSNILLHQERWGDKLGTRSFKY